MLRGGGDGKCIGCFWLQKQPLDRGRHTPAAAGLGEEKGGWLHAQPVAGDRDLGFIYCCGEGFLVEVGLYSRG